MRVDELPETKYRTEKSNKQHTQNCAGPSLPQPACDTKVHIQPVTRGNAYVRFTCIQNLVLTSSGRRCETKLNWNCTRPSCCYYLPRTLAPPTPTPPKNVPHNLHIFWTSTNITYTISEICTNCKHRQRRSYTTSFPQHIQNCNQIPPTPFPFPTFAALQFRSTKTRFSQPQGSKFDSQSLRARITLLHFDPSGLETG